MTGLLKVNIFIICWNRSCDTVLEAVIQSARPRIDFNASINKKSVFMLKKIYNYFELTPHVLIRVLFSIWNVLFHTNSPVTRLLPTRQISINRWIGLTPTWYWQRVTEAHSADHSSCDLRGVVLIDSVTATGGASGNVRDNGDGAWSVGGNGVCCSS